MSKYRTILEVLEANGQLPPKPRGTEYAIKCVGPDWKTYGGYQWPFPGKWTPPVENFNPAPCEGDGVHVAFTLEAAQSGGGLPNHCLVVAYRPSEAGNAEFGNLKVQRAKTLAPTDLLRAIRANGRYADLRGAYLRGASLRGADLRGADLTGAYLSGADLARASLTRADLTEADLRGASLREADLSGADLTEADLRGAYLWGRNINELRERGAIV